MKNFRLKFEGRWFEYVALGIILAFFGNEIAKYEIKPLFILGTLLGIAGALYFLKGIYLGIKKIFYAQVQK